MEQIGRYQLLRKIAVGGMAEVFLAKAAGPHGFEKTLVVKRILPHLAEDPSYVEMFLCEARVAAQLNHPNVVQIFDFGQADGAYYIAMEFIDGPNLRVVIRQANQSGIPLPLSLCARFAASACEGLCYAHEFCNPETGESLGLIHRDVSPENIIVSRNGTIKVVDFGIVKASAGQAHRTAAGTLKGKVAYMPPEQLLGATLDLRADVFALGMVLYEAITGRKPFDAVSEVAMMQAILQHQLVPANQRRPDVPESLLRILDIALAKDREQRYSSCREFQFDLEKFIISTGVPAGTAQLAELAVQVMGSSGGTPAPKIAPLGTPARAKPQPSAPPRPFTPNSAPPAATFIRAQPPPLPVRAPTSSDLATILQPTPSPGPQPLTQQPPEPELQIPIEVVRAPIPTPAPAKKTDRPGPRAGSIALGVVSVVAAGVVGALLLGGGSRTVTDSKLGSRARVSIETAPPSKIRVNGHEVGNSPVTLNELEPGVIKVEAFSPTLGFVKKVAFNLAPGDNGIKKISISKGTLEFRVPAGTTVFVDGKPYGDAPVPSLQVFEGTHMVELFHRSLRKELSISVEVQPDAPNIVSHDWGNGLSP